MLQSNIHDHERSFSHQMLRNNPLAFFAIPQIVFLVLLAAASGTRALELPPLGYKKWGLKDQGVASDHISAGSYTPNPFDQMQAASLVKYYN